MKIALTGATGLLGANLAMLLCERGHDLTCTRRRASDTRYLREFPIRRIESDLSDRPSLEEAFAGAEAVFHCAALVGYGPFIDKNIDAVNVEGTKNVVAAALSARVDRLIHCSSVDALGLPAGSVPADESTPWDWDARGLDFGYARSKRLAESIVLACADIDALIVNPTFLIGPYDQHPSSGRLLLRIAQGRVPFYPGGKNNFVDVRDVCKGMLSALERGKRGERYILGGENLSYQEFFRLVSRLSGSGRRLWPAPRLAALAAGRGGDIYERLSGRPADLNSQIAALGYVDHIYSSAKAERELGYAHAAIEPAVKAALDWFRLAGML